MLKLDSKQPFKLLEPSILHDRKLRMRPYEVKCGDAEMEQRSFDMTGWR